LRRLADRIQWFGAGNRPLVNPAASSADWHIARNEVRLQLVKNLHRGGDRKAPAKADVGILHRALSEQARRLPGPCAPQGRHGENHAKDGDHFWPCARRQHLLPLIFGQGRSGARIADADGAWPDCSRRMGKAREEMGNSPIGSPALSQHPDCLFVPDNRRAKQKARRCHRAFRIS